MKVWMNMKEIIGAINGTYEFAGKGYKFTYPLRRAMRMNLRALEPEYKIFDEERNRILSEAESTDPNEIAFAEKKVLEMMEYKVKVDIEKVPESELKNVETTYYEEKLIDYMLTWPEDEEKEEETTDERGN